MDQETKNEKLAKSFYYYRCPLSECESGAEDCLQCPRAKVDSGMVIIAEAKDQQFIELVKSYIQLAYDSGQPANLLEDLLKEI